MFNIHLVDIGGDGLVTEFNSSIDTLAELEIMVTAVINKHLGIHTTVLVYDDDLVYSVYVNGHEIGVVAIKDVNSNPKGVTNETDTRK